MNYIGRYQLFPISIKYNSLSNLLAYLIYKIIYNTPSYKLYSTYTKFVLRLTKYLTYLSFC